jgi:hypothetical protein
MEKQTSWLGAIHRHAPMWLVIFSHSEPEIHSVWTKGDGMNELDKGILLSLHKDVLGSYLSE